MRSNPVKENYKYNGHEKMKWNQCKLIGNSMRGIRQVSIVSIVKHASIHISKVNKLHIHPHSQFKKQFAGFESSYKFMTINFCSFFQGQQQKQIKHNDRKHQYIAITLKTNRPEKTYNTTYN